MLGTMSEDAEVRRVSWDRLARAYYQPVYTYLRLRWRKSEDEARDLAQAFFARCLEKGTVAGYASEKGRFRSFLRACLDNYVLDDRRRATTVARGRAFPVAVDMARAEAEIACEAEEAFDAEWVRQVIALAVEALRAHCRDSGKLEHMTIFERYHLQGEDPPTYAALAAELSISVNDVTNRLAYARRKFRRYVLDVLRDITATEEEYRNEARKVLGVEL